METIPAASTDNNKSQPTGATVSRFEAVEINGRFRRPQDAGQDLHLRELRGAIIPQRLRIAASEVRSNETTLSSLELGSAMIVQMAYTSEANIADSHMEPAVQMREDGHEIVTFYARF
jgi:hypothetical protein